MKGNQQPPESFYTMRTAAWQKYMADVRTPWLDTMDAIKKMVDTFSNSKKPNPRTLAVTFVKLQEDYAKECTPMYLKYLETATTGFLGETMEKANESNKISKLLKAIEKVKETPVKKRGGRPKKKKKRKAKKDSKQ